MLLSFFNLDNSNKFSLKSISKISFDLIWKILTEYCFFIFLEISSRLHLSEEKKVTSLLILNIYNEPKLDVKIIFLYSGIKTAKEAAPLIFL